METDPESEGITADEMAAYLVRKLFERELSIRTKGRSCAEQVLAGILARCSMAEAQFPEEFTGLTTNTEDKLSIYFRIDSEVSFIQRKPLVTGIVLPPVSPDASVYDQLRSIAVQFAVLSTEYDRAKRRPIPQRYKHDGTKVMRTIMRRNMSLVMTERSKYVFEHMLIKTIESMFDLIDLNVGKMRKEVLEAKVASMRQDIADKVTATGSGNTNARLKELGEALDKVLQEALTTA